MARTPKEEIRAGKGTYDYDTERDAQQAFQAFPVRRDLVLRRYRPKVLQAFAEHAHASVEPESASSTLDAAAAAEIERLAGRTIPAEDLGPGAKEAGIDRMATVARTVPREPVLTGSIPLKPILSSRLENHVTTIPDFHVQRMYSRRERRGAETENIIVRHVIRGRDQTPLQVLDIMEVKELASRQFRNCFRGVDTQRIARG